MHEHMRTDSNKLRIRAPIRQSKHLVANFETPLRLIAQLHNHTRELYTECFGGLRRNGIHALALEQVHTIEPEGFDSDEGLRASGFGLGDVGYVEGFDGAFAAFDIWK
jgi:hypothetical protein